MANAERDIVVHESHLARRVARLFRYERAGRLARRQELERRFARRRGELIDALLRTDAARRGLRIPVSPDLQNAVEALWRETEAARRDADARLDRLRADLSMAWGDGVPSGVHGVAGGRIVGRG